jgi:hypothetical protein
MPLLASPLLPSQWWVGTKLSLSLPASAARHTMSRHLEDHGRQQEGRQVAAQGSGGGEGEQQYRMQLLLLYRCMLTMMNGLLFEFSLRHFVLIMRQHTMR